MKALIVAGTASGVGKTTVTLASYVHLHFGSCPELPVRLLARAAR
jgi:cobyrinic acid a,c-diamide synthase